MPNFVKMVRFPVLFGQGDCFTNLYEVSIDLGQPLFPIAAFHFCCGPGFSSNLSCNTSTHGSYQPFEVAAGSVIFNRSDGSIGPNSTTTGNSTCRVAEIAVGVGVGSPLLLTLLVFLGLFLIEMRRKHDLLQEVKAWERKCLGLRHSSIYQRKAPETVRVVTELNGGPIAELYGDSPSTGNSQYPWYRDK